MAALVAGIARAPLMSILLGLELTHALDALLPMVKACFVAYGLSVLALRRSVFTEKITRDGLHATREYSIDSLEVLSVAETMQTEISSVFLVVDDGGKLIGVVTSTDLARIADNDDRHVGDIAQQRPIAARMVTIATWHLPVVARDDPRQLIGLIPQRELLVEAHERLRLEEKRRL